MPISLDPGKSGDFLSSTLICLIYEGLTRSLNDGDVEMALAEKVEISPDGCTYRFILRDAMWSDGHPVTAFDFETSWKRLVDPSFPCLASHLVMPIQNAKKCIQGQLPPSWLGVQAENAKILRVTLEQPTPWFLSLTAFPLFLPVPAHLDSTLCNPPICNGPFVLTSSHLNQRITFQKNDSFWNKDAIHLDQITIHIIHDEHTALHLFEQGEIDWIGAPLSPLPLDALSSLMEKQQIHRIPMLASTFLVFNTQKPPFHHLLIRKALSLSLNRHELVNEIAIGQIEAIRPLPQPLASSSTPLIGFHPQEAKHALQQGLAELHLSLTDLPPITLSYRAGQLEKRLAQAIQQQWEEQLGLQVQLEQVEPKMHMERLHLRNIEVALTSWIAQINDPICLLERMRLSTHPKNFSAWESKAYQALLDRADLAQTASERHHLFAQAEEVLMQELPFTPLYHWSSATMNQPWVVHGGTTPSGGILFERFDLLNSDHSCHIIERARY